MKVFFTIPGEPKGKGRPRFNTRTGRAFTPTDTQSYEHLVKLMYLKQCEGIKYDKETMLVMEVKAFYGIPKSDSMKKKNMKLSGIIRPIKVPDVDNIVKIVADSLNKLAYYDDSQIVKCHVSKWYSENPRVEVFIDEII